MCGCGRCALFVWNRRETTMKLRALLLALALGVCVLSTLGAAQSQCQTDFNRMFNGTYPFAKQSTPCTAAAGVPVSPVWALGGTVVGRRVPSLGRGGGAVASGC